MACHKNCLGCSGPKLDQCTSCKKVLLEKKTPTETTGKCPSSCEPKFYLTAPDSYECQPCDTRCHSCEKRSTKCLSCDSETKPPRIFIPEKNWCQIQCEKGFFYTITDGTDSC